MDNPQSAGHYCDREPTTDKHVLTMPIYRCPFWWLTIQSSIIINNVNWKSKIMENHHKPTLTIIKHPW